MAELPVQPTVAPFALADVVEHLPGAVIAVDLDSRVVHWSDGAERLYGYTAHEAVGRSVRELILGGEESRADEVKARTHAGGQWDGELPARHKDGRPLVVSVSNAPLRDAAGAVVGVVAISLDMSAHAAVQDERAAQLQQAHDRAELLVDRQARLVQVSEALGRALTPAQVVDVVLEQGVEALGADAGGIVGVEGESMRVLGTVGYEDAVVQTYQALPLDAQTPLTDVVRTRQPMLLASRAELVARYPDMPHSSLSESFAGIPLEVDGRIVGVMALSAGRSAAFPEQDLEFLLTWAASARRRSSAAGCSPPRATRDGGWRSSRWPARGWPRRWTTTRPSTPSPLSPSRLPVTGAPSTCSTSPAPRSW